MNSILSFAIIILTWLTTTTFGCSPENKPIESQSFNIGKKKTPESRKAYDNKFDTTAENSLGIVSSAQARSKSISELRTKRENEQQLELVPLKAIPIPILTDVPIINVVDMGLEPLRINNHVYDIFYDRTEQIQYLVTDKHIVFQSKGKVIRKVALKYDTTFRGHDNNVVVSKDGRWIWQFYRTADSNYEESDTDIYDSAGNLAWHVNDGISSVSPDGTKASVANTYYRKEWKNGKYLEPSNRSLRYSNSCVFDEGVIAIRTSGPPSSEIVAYNNDLHKVNQHAIQAMCKLIGCVEHLNRALIECGDYSTKEAVMLILDSTGSVVSKTWLPYLGEKMFHFNSKENTAIVSNRYGQFISVNTVNGKVIGVGTKIVDGFSDESDIFDRKKRVGKFLVTRVLGGDGYVARIRTPCCSENPKERKFDIVDLSGDVAFSKSFEIHDAALRQHVDLPVTSLNGKKIFLHSENKSHVIKVVREVKK